MCQLTSLLTEHLDFVSGFHTSRNLCARMGDRFSFSVAWDQMLVAWGDWVPLEHSLRYVTRVHTKQRKYGGQ